MIRIIAIGICTVLVLGWIVNSTIKGAKQKRNVVSIYQRILLNHLQFIILTSAFDMNWSELMQKYFSISKPLGETTTQIFSIDCFLNRNTKSSDGMS